VFAGGEAFGDGDSPRVRAGPAQQWGTAPLVPQNGSSMHGAGGRDTAKNHPERAACRGESAPEVGAELQANSTFSAEAFGLMNTNPQHLQ